MDRIFVHGIEVDALIGVYAHEREGAQPLRIDLEIDVDLAASARSDAVADTVDYAEVVAEVRAQVAARQPELLESLAQALADALLARWPAMQALRVTVHKPQAARALGCADVGIVLRRERPR